MTIRSRVLPACLLLISLFLFVRCSDSNKDDNMDPEAATLFDKWWYSSVNTADIYIYSNGNFEQNYSGTTPGTFVGQWTWEDESTLLMKVDYDPGQGAGQPTVAWLRFSKLTDTTVDVEQSVTGQSGSFAGPFAYTTTK